MEIPYAFRPERAIARVGALVLLSASLLLSACGYPPRLDDATSPPVVHTVATACLTIARARCTAQAGCCPAEGKPPAKAAPGAKPSDACIDTAQAACAADFDGYRAALDAGLLAFDYTHVQACALAIQSGASRCGPPAQPQAQQTCGELLTVPVELGAPCPDVAFQDTTRSPLLCAKGAGRCRSSSGKRTCTALAERGEGCEGHVDCAGTMRCVPATPGQRKALICQDASKAGAPCVTDQDCWGKLLCSPKLGVCIKGGGASAPCDDMQPCGSGFVCAPSRRCEERSTIGTSCRAHVECPTGATCDGLTLQGSCVALLPAGATCTTTAACAENLSCAPNTATQGGPRRCQPKVVAGEPCTQNADCVEAAYCDAKKKCVQRPGLDEPCAWSSRSCAVGLTCYQPTKTDRTCVKPRAMGEACSQPNNCVAGLTCRDNVCVALPAKGELCGGLTFCADGWCDYKSGGVCSAWRKTGEACYGGHECGPSGTCVGTNPSDLRCRPIPREGEACLLTCQSGLRCKLVKKPGVCRSMLCTPG